MNVEETLRVLSALKSAGATHFKSQDFEITLHASKHPVVPAPQEYPHFAPEPAAPPAQNEDATQKLKDLIGTLNMSNEDLVDKIFPAGSGG